MSAYLRVMTGCGAPGRTRTPDLPLRRRLLYPLSYWCSRLSRSASRPRKTIANGGRVAVRPAGRRLAGPGRCWSGRRDSNSRHTAWKAVALPTELLPHAGDHRRPAGPGCDALCEPSPCGAWRRYGHPLAGRGGWIRTSDPLLPKQVRYQTALRPVTAAASSPCSGRIGAVVSRLPARRRRRPQGGVYPVGRAFTTK